MLGEAETEGERDGENEPEGEWESVFAKFTKDVTALETKPKTIDDALLKFVKLVLLLFWFTNGIHIIYCYLYLVSFCLLVIYYDTQKNLG